MNVIGIIAEYNPFHNGHAYQIAHVKKNLHADYIVVAASGDYVQRGEPALLDKYTRARMALSSGADLVLELPVLWSTASAELFADAGISLFEKTGCVNGICFGAESGDLALLRRIADVLADEPAALKASLKRNLKSGNTFPKAMGSCPALLFCRRRRSGWRPARIHRDALLPARLPEQHTGSGILKIAAPPRVFDHALSAKAGRRRIPRNIHPLRRIRSPGIRVRDPAYTLRRWRRIIRRFCRRDSASCHAAGGTVHPAGLPGRFSAAVRR